MFFSLAGILCNERHGEGVRAVAARKDLSSREKKTEPERNLKIVNTSVYHRPRVCLDRAPRKQFFREIIQ